MLRGEIEGERESGAVTVGVKVAETKGSQLRPGNQRPKRCWSKQDVAG